MKNKDFEKYLGELSPEPREKARQRRDKYELNDDGLITVYPR